jgi:hypothetical protein
VPLDVLPPRGGDQVGGLITAQGGQPVHLLVNLRRDSHSGGAHWGKHFLRDSPFIGRNTVGCNAVTL